MYRSYGSPEAINDDYSTATVSYGTPPAISKEYPPHVKLVAVLASFYLIGLLAQWWAKWTPTRQTPLARPAPKLGDVRSSRLAVLGSAPPSRTPSTPEESRKGTAAVAQLLPAREAMIRFSRRRQVTSSNDGKNPYWTLQRLRSNGDDTLSVHAAIPTRYLFPTDYTGLPTRSLKWIGMVPDNTVTDLSHPTMQVIIARVYDAVGRVTGAFHRATLAEKIPVSEIPLSLANHIAAPMPGCMVLGVTMFNTCRRGVSRFTYLRTGFECCEIVIRRGLSVEGFIETLAHELAHVIVHLEAKHPSNPYGRAPFSNYTAMEEGICTAVSLLAAGYLSGKTFTRSEVTDSVMKAVLMDKEKENEPESDTVKKELPDFAALAGKEFVKGSYGETFRHVMRHIDMFPTFLDLLDTYLKHGFV
ncbi:hypothetical protein HDU86_003843 [Geranomyces michiganensis]|nr:hypothetical protein HDU86_003843 [Geranomyces michiganensis]